jgi:hypothetical protein
MESFRRFCLYVAVIALSVPPFDGQAPASGEPPRDSPVHQLAVQPQQGGGVRATATLLFPGPPSLVQSILTDYPRWPELFETRMRIARVEQHGSRVLIELFISHVLLPGERRLLCESQVLPGGGLVTELKGGDFKQYRRVWKLEPAGDGTQTRAEFDLLVEVDTIVPDWMIALAMERELEAHFRIVRERALETMVNRSG